MTQPALPLFDEWNGIDYSGTRRSQFASPPVSPVVREIHRRENNRDRVLHRLRQGPASTMELVAIGGIRASGRCSDLRKLGYAIDAENKGDGLWIYTLSGEPT